MERRQRSQQPGAGAAAVPGVMERGQRRGPLSECVPGQHGGRATGAAKRKRPARCCGGDRARVGCRGSQCQRRGCRNSEGVAAPGALAGAAALRIAAVVLARAALRHREHLPDGKPLPVCAGLGRERRAGFAAMPHLTKGRSPCPEGAAERRRGMVRRRALRRPPGRRKARG